MRGRQSGGMNVFWISLVSIAFLLFSCSEERDQDKISASGTIEVIEVSVAPKIGGQVTKIAVQEGSRVKGGDILAVIDSSALEIQLQQAEAGVNLAQAPLRLLLEGSRAEDIRYAEETLKQAEANLKVAEEDLNRIRNLYEKASTTAKMKDDAEARYKVARAQYEASRQILLKLTRGARPEEIKAARARLAQAEAARDLLKKNISDCTIISPTRGMVTHKPVEEGEFVAPGTPLLTVADLEKVRLKVYITEPELGKVGLGQAAEVKIDSYPDRTFLGKVIFISPEAEFTPKNIQTKEERTKLVYAVKIEIENPENILKPGMPADAVIKETPIPSS